jgi:hypothetical protein
MDGFFHFLQTLVLCLTGLIVALMVLVVVIMNMKPNPLRDLLVSLLWRLGATLGLAMIAPPIQAVPVVDVTYDVGGLILLIMCWIGFFKDFSNVMRGKKASTQSLPKTVFPHRSTRP